MFGTRDADAGLLRAWNLEWASAAHECAVRWARPPEGEDPLVSAPPPSGGQGAQEGEDALVSAPQPPFQAVWSKSFPFLGPRPGRVQDTSLRFTALCLEVRDLVRHRAQVLTVRRGHYHGCTRAAAKRRSSGTFQTSI